MPPKEKVGPKSEYDTVPASAGRFHRDKPTRLLPPHERRDFHDGAFGRPIATAISSDGHVASAYDVSDEHVTACLVTTGQERRPTAREAFSAGYSAGKRVATIPVALSPVDPVTGFAIRQGVGVVSGTYQAGRVYNRNLTQDRVTEAAARAWVDGSWKAEEPPPAPSP